MRKNGYDFLVFIGRFQPFHNGHLSVIRAGLKQADQLIVLCGSAYQARSARNPWSETEREAMIRSALTDAQSKRVRIAPLVDIPDDDAAWVREVQAVVSRQVMHSAGDNCKHVRIALIGHRKDHSSYYLALFKHWGVLEVDDHCGLNASALRQALFVKKTPVHALAADLPPGVQRVIDAFLRGLAARSPGDESALTGSYASRSIGVFPDSIGQVLKRPSVRDRRR